MSDLVFRHAYLLFGVTLMSRLTRWAAPLSTYFSPEKLPDHFAVDRSRLRAAKEVLALVAFTADDYSENRFVSGLLEIGLAPARDLLFSSEHGNIPAHWNSIEQGLWTVLNGIPFNQLLCRKKIG